MGKRGRQAAAAVFAAVCMLAAGAFAPARPRAAWWCTAFAVTPAEAVQPAAGTDGVVFRLWLADWLRARLG